jgi:molybdopterin-guanine dinucleotide biosynthesis protein A
MTHRRCTGVILAGGAATRLGGVRKGLLPVGGRRILDRVAAALARASDEMLLVANDPEADGWLPGVRVVPDGRRGSSASMVGLESGLAVAGSSVLVVAWDMPFVPGPLLCRLRQLGEAGASVIDAVVPRGAGGSGAQPGRPEPLCAYYAAHCATAVARRLDRGDHRLTALLADLRVHYLDARDLAVYGDPDVLFANVNTRDDLAGANARAAASPTEGVTPHELE